MSSRSSQRSTERTPKPQRGLGYKSLLRYREQGTRRVPCSLHLGSHLDPPESATPEPANFLAGPEDSRRPKGVEGPLDSGGASDPSGRSSACMALFIGLLRSALRWVLRFAAPRTTTIPIGYGWTDLLGSGQQGGDACGSRGSSRPRSSAPQNRLSWAFPAGNGPQARRQRQDGVLWSLTNSDPAWHGFSLSRHRSRRCHPAAP